MCECEIKESRGYVVIYITWKYLSMTQPIKITIHHRYFLVANQMDNLILSSLIECWHPRLNDSSDSIFKRKTFLRPHANKRFMLQQHLVLRSQRATWHLSFTSNPVDQISLANSVTSITVPPKLIGYPIMCVDAFPVKLEHCS